MLSIHIWKIHLNLIQGRITSPANFHAIFIFTNPGVLYSSLTLEQVFPPKLVVGFAGSRQTLVLARRIGLEAPWVNEILQLDLTGTGFNTRPGQLGFTEAVLGIFQLEARRVPDCC